MVMEVEKRVTTEMEVGRLATHVDQAIDSPQRLDEPSMREALLVCREAVHALCLVCIHAWREGRSGFSPIRAHGFGERACPRRRRQLKASPSADAMSKEPREV